MNKEEIQEAIKIIKEPITVNSIEYKYFTQENYEKLLRVYENCQWFINNWEQLEQNIKDLQKKAEVGEHYKHLYSEVKEQKDDVVELCNKSIKSINDRLAWVDTKQTYPNEYQRIRLKAFRTKCKEILRLLGECNE